jgi:AcrR family transcriptional regulator
VLRRINRVGCLNHGKTHQDGLTLTGFPRKVRTFVNFQDGVLRKGEQTRVAIIGAAVDLAARVGLEGLTIGALAERMQMSKSGVFAHFGSREDLQIAVLKHYEQQFAQDVLRPALTAPRGLMRLKKLFENWLERTAFEAANGCIYISGATDYDDRPGPVREELVAMVGRWQKELKRAIGLALQTHELDASTDIDEFVFQLYGVILVLHHDARLMRSPDAVPRAKRSFERLLTSYMREPALA